MRLSRIFSTQSLRSGAVIELDERAARYIGQVLRLRAGDSITLFDGSGSDFAAQLTRCDRRGCSARLGDARPAEQPARLQIHLGIGISRGERMDLAIQKSVELGVNAISPLLTERCVVQLRSERLVKRLAHWQGVVISACEQCGRSRLPALHPPGTLAAWLSQQPGGLMLHHEAAQTLATLAAPRDDLSLLIGPEGGLTQAEREIAGAANFCAVRLGPRVLRTETAPLAALAAIQALWGDFR